MQVYIYGLSLYETATKIIYTADAIILVINVNKHKLVKVCLNFFLSSRTLLISLSPY